MADDFRRLVSQSNPAARQYQPANNGYPPSSLNTPYNDVQSPQLLDPFFDDEDEQLHDSGFGRPEPMRSQESGLPLARSAAPPAGLGPSQISLGDGAPQGWNFDDDDFRPANHPSLAGSASFPGVKPHSEGPSPSRRRRWKWPWDKETEVKGERIIALNNSAANEFCSNFISTSKYSLITFVPKFFYGKSFGLHVTRLTKLISEQFSKYANLFFLFTACIQQIPGVSPTNQYTTIAPLAVVLMASAFKEMQEDLVRFQCST